MDLDKFNYYLEKYLIFSKSTKSCVLLSIVKTVDNYFNKKNKKIINFLEISSEEAAHIVTLFIYKSMSVSRGVIHSFDENFANSDEVLNTLVDLYECLSIFYSKSLPLLNEIIEFKKDLFKIIKTLILDNVVISEQIFYNNKTLER